MKSIEITFNGPIAGYWDGGKKSGGTFKPRIVKGGYEEKPDLKQHVLWECFELNYWFRTPLENAEKTACRKLRHTVSYLKSLKLV